MSAEPDTPSVGRPLADRLTPNREHGVPVESLPLPAWFRTPQPVRRASIAAGATLPEVVLAAARAAPGTVVLADERTGARTYRDIVTAILALQPALRALPGPYLGLMFPASAAAGITYLAALFAGKTPVMVNWTGGVRGMTAGLDALGVRHILTAQPVLDRLRTTVPGLDALADRFRLLEALRALIPPAARLASALRARLGLWPAPPDAAGGDTAAILFTSGSEALPKIVPLTHANLLANLRDIVKVFPFQTDDRLIGLLPPFHSFGLTVTTLLPLTTGVPVVYHPVPTEGGRLARLIEAYRVSILVGTPTFVSTIFHAAGDARLASLRAAITGAERCPQALYETDARRWPHGRVIEGYGVTECSPAIALGDANAHRPGTIGKVLPSFEYALRDPQTGARTPRGAVGELLVRGPSVFPGYLGPAGASPFVEWEGASWYATRDLVREDADGVLTYAGRLGRFIKRGGEMVSLPAIEDALAKALGVEAEPEPRLAVEATADELNPQIVLYSVPPVSRDAANRALRDAGLSALHHIHSVVRVERIPLLGTGKTDYRALAARGKSVQCSVFGVQEEQPTLQPRNRNHEPGTPPP